MFDNPIMGTVIPFAGEVEPDGWKFCQGQELKISENAALYTLIGDTFGGDRQTIFKLPNLCGRVAVHAGRGAGMQPYTRGQALGNEKVSISVDNLPVHTHGVAITGKPKCTNANGTEDVPGGHYPAHVAGSPDAYSSGRDTDTHMGTTHITAETTEAFPGVQQQVPVLSPYLAMNFIICIEGYYPSRPD